MQEYSCNMDAEEIRALRMERGWTQVELARRSGISQASVSRIERGELRAPKALLRALGVGERRPEARVERPARPSPTMAWRPTIEPAPQHLDVRRWQRPEVSGDALALVALPRGGVLVLALDVAGHGVEQVPKVAYLQGWLRGWTRGLSVIPRIESFAEDLSAELVTTHLDAAWYAAIVNPQHPSPHRVAYQGMSQRFPAPLVLVGAPPTTLPAVGPAGAPARHDLWPPWRLVIASDGLLRRLGGGDERHGKAQLLSWQAGVERDRSPDADLSTSQPLADDELYADITYGRWDGSQDLDLDDDTQRHRLKRRLRQELTLGQRARDAFGVAVGEAIKNAMKHAYAVNGGRATISWRDEGDRARVDVEDAGSGTPPFREGGGFAIMRAHTDAVDVRRRYPAGTVVSLTKSKEASDDRS